MAQENATTDAAQNADAETTITVRYRTPTGVEEIQAEFITNITEHSCSVYTDTGPEASYERIKPLDVVSVEAPSRLTVRMDDGETFECDSIDGPTSRTWTILTFNGSDGQEKLGAKHTEYIGVAECENEEDDR